MLQHERALDLEFRKQWSRPEDYPACPAGLTLLRRFAEAYPDLYETFVAHSPDAPKSVPALTRNPKWIEYRVHWGTCDDCMEV